MPMNINSDCIEIVTREVMYKNLIQIELAFQLHAQCVSRKNQ